MSKRRQGSVPRARTTRATRMNQRIQPLGGAANQSNAKLAHDNSAQVSSDGLQPAGTARRRRHHRRDGIILVPRASAARDKANQKACEHNRALINSAAERFAVTIGAAPASLNDLNTPDYFPDGIPVCPVSGNAYTLDAGTQRVTGHSGGAHP